jgi:hypothetical protein
LGVCFNGTTTYHCGIVGATFTCKKGFDKNLLAMFKKNARQSTQRAHSFKNPVGH